MQSVTVMAVIVASVLAAGGGRAKVNAYTSCALPSAAVATTERPSEPTSRETGVPPTLVWVPGLPSAPEAAMAAPPKLLVVTSFGTLAV